jgi:predicted secreted Zn-dependent protease
MRFAVFAVTCALLFSSVGAAAEVRLVLTTSYYDIRANDEAELARQLWSPPRPDGRSSLATTANLFLNASQTKMVRASECRYAPVRILLVTTVTYPRLVTSSPALRRNWQKHFPRLQRHEELHARLAARQAPKFEAALGRLSARDCATLQAIGEQQWTSMQTAYGRVQDATESEGYALTAAWYADLTRHQPRQ